MLLKKTLSLTAMAMIATVGLSACSHSEQDSTSSSTVTTPAMAATETSAAVADQGLSFSDGYVRAMEPGAEMTAIFGVLSNDSDKPITITEVKSSIDADSFELHEVVDGKMQVKEGGFTLAPGEELVLEPGREHFMAMGVHTPVEAGEDVTLTLILDDGTEVNLEKIPARTVAAGNESYGDMTSHEGHDHSTEMSGHDHSTEMSEHAH